MKKLSWKKVGCLLLALLMAATMLATGVVAVDTDTSILDPNAAVSLTLHKRDMKSPLEEDQYGQNDGTVMDDPNGDPLPDVTFTAVSYTHLRFLPADERPRVSKWNPLLRLRAGRLLFLVLRRISRL